MNVHHVILKVHHGGVRETFHVVPIENVASKDEAITEALDAERFQQARSVVPVAVSYDSDVLYAVEPTYQMLSRPVEELL